jgi:hypothetical protein
MCISGFDYAQKLNPESGSHDKEPYARLLEVRHIQTRRCVRIIECSRLLVLESSIVRYFFRCPGHCGAIAHAC